MKEVVGQFTFAVISPERSDRVVFVIPEDNEGRKRPDMVLASNGVAIRNPAIPPELRHQAINHAQKSME